MQVTRTKKSKAPDKRPARQRYWQLGKLRKHKVRNLMRCCGMTEREASDHWREVRKGRMK
jgi:hypothetical protein